MKKIFFGVLGGLGLICTAAFAEDCNQADTLYNRSLAEEHAKEKLLQEVLTLCPTHVHAMNNLAVLAEQRGRQKDAEGYYRKIIEVQSDFPPAYAGLGDVLAVMGQYREAANAYADFLKLIHAKAKKGQASGFEQHRASYQAKLEEVQRKINPDAMVSTLEITKNLTASVMATRDKRGIRDVVRPPQVDLNIHFDTGSDTVQNRSIPQLEQVALALASPGLAKTRIRIEGHTDSDGSVEFNRDLSMRRAKKVQQILAKQYSLSQDRFEVVGRGKEYPVASNETPNGRALNRRVTFVNVGQGGN
ncbi:MAG: OmpA family protein [Magnetococcus sp. YQC-5]